LEIRQLPALRVLILFFSCYLLLMQFSFWVVSFLVLIFFLIIYLRYRAFKNSILFFTLAIICCFRIQYKPEVSVPPKCYKIQKIVKENHQKIIFIAEGKEKVLFTLKRFGNDSSGYYCNDVIEYRGRLKSLPVPKNLKDFVYADYLTKTGVDSLAYPTTFPRVVHRDSTSIVFYASKIKKTIASYLFSFSKITNSTKGFTIALLIGDKSFLNKRGYELFRESGVIHVLAISGLHIGILYITLNFLFSKLLRFNKKAVFYVVAILLVGYAFVTGLSPSVIRAVIMFTLIQFGKSYHKSTNTLNIVISSAFLMLFYEPNLIIDVGFQLSYSAVIGIVLIMQHSGLELIIRSKPFGFIWSILLVNFAAFIFTAPIIAFHFGVINFTSIWASILVVPIITIVMFVGLLLLIFSLNNFFAEKLYLLLDYLFSGLIWILNFIIEHTHFLIRVFLDTSGTIIFFSILLCIFFRKLKWSIIIALSCLVLFLLPKNQQVQLLKINDRLEIKHRNKVYSVKKGDSLFLNSAQFFFEQEDLLKIETKNKSRLIDFNVNNYECLILEF